MQFLPIPEPLGEEIAIRDGAGMHSQLWEQAGSMRTCSGALRHLGLCRVLCVKRSGRESTDPSALLGNGAAGLGRPCSSGAVPPVRAASSPSPWWQPLHGHLGCCEERKLLFPASTERRSPGREGWGKQ